jgi:hypothetical protein
MDGRREDVWHLHIETIHLCKRVEIQKKKGKKKKKSTPSNLFLLGISGLYNQQLQADPTFTSPVTQNPPPSPSIRRTERGNRPTSNTTNRAAIVELLLLGGGSTQHTV